MDPTYAGSLFRPEFLHEYNESIFKLVYLNLCFLKSDVDDFGDLKVLVDRNLEYEVSCCG